ncbi:hypothetical protein Nepgr_021766 [Nepenthes gracilis]|uniref:Uncharacterized protein n=1 Tax=Nepenthes gracilis TaxID=150966 RepID=A0AAD3SY25_NEPGR|nr:hypothetical protein Nepgr_021766 [Nepenthes gracilis]
MDGGQATIGTLVLRFELEFHLLFAPAPPAIADSLEALETLPPSSFHHSVDSKSSPLLIFADFAPLTSFCSSSPPVSVFSPIPHSLGRLLFDEVFPPLSVVHPSLPNAKKVEGFDLIRVKAGDLSSKRHDGVSDGMAPSERESSNPDSNMLLQASAILNRPGSLHDPSVNSPVALPGISPKNSSSGIPTPPLNPPDNSKIKGWNGDNQFSWSAVVQGSSCVSSELKSLPHGF